MENKHDNGFCIHVCSPGNFIAKEMTFNQPVYIGCGQPNDKSCEVEECDVSEEEAAQEADGDPALPTLVGKEEELNYFQPILHLKNMLKGEWFKTCRTDEKYGQQWCEEFVDSLMASEYKDGIARDWAVKGRSKKELIRSYVVGCLKDAGVLEGSYDAIARAIWGTNKYRSHAIHFGQGKKQPYHLWIKDYVGEH